MKRKSSLSNLSATAMVALGLSILSPTQWVMTGAALGAVAVAAPAWAQTGIPGVGVIIKKKPGNAPIVAPSDNNGVIRLSGLEPGDYEVKLIGEASPTHIKVGRDGVLTTRAVMSDDGKDRSIEDLTGKDVKADTFDLKALFAYDRPNMPRAMRGQPPARPMARPRFVDVNASSAEEITKLTPTTSPDAAQAIVGERDKNGAYKDPIDFANRVCSKTSVDFGFAPTLIGNAQIVARGTSPGKTNGFKCAPTPRGADPTFELYGKKHNYVGHVTLLR